MSNTDRTSGLQRILKQIEADGLETINKFDRETNDELKKGKQKSSRMHSRVRPK